MEDTFCIPCISVKKYKAAELQEDQPVSQGDVLEVEEPYYEIEKILRWRKVKRKNKIIKQYLVLWRGYPVEDAMWIEADQFSYPSIPTRGSTPGGKSLSGEDTTRSKGGVVVTIMGISYICAHVPMSPRARTSASNAWYRIKVTEICDDWVPW